MIIKSHQVGGIVYSPFGSSTRPATNSSQTPEKISGTMKKEVIDILTESGIPSDVDAFLNAAHSFLGKSTSLSNMSLFGGTNDDYSMSDLIVIQKMANTVKWNKDIYDKAVSNLNDEDAWGDVAIDSTGDMYVMDRESKKITTIDPAKFQNEKYSVLTNRQMLELRTRSASYAMDSGILNDMRATVGIKTVEDFLVGLVEKLGTTTSQGYGSKEQARIINGIQNLMEAGPDGYYKITDKQQARDVHSALQYLHNQLTPQMKKTLEATIAANGGDVQKDKLKFLGLILTQNIDWDQKADFDSSATKSAGIGAEGGGGAMGEVPYLVRIGRGDGQYDLVNISMRTDKVTDSGSMVAWAANMGDLIDKNQNKIGLDSLTNVLEKCEAIRATRSKDITFGGQLLTDVEKNFIVYDGTSQLTDVWLPFTTVGGKITPDFEKLEKFNEWSDWIKEHPNLTKVEKLNEAYKRGLNPNEMTYDEQSGIWKFKPEKMKLFLSFGAYADNDNVKFTKRTENLTEELSWSEGAHLADMFDTLFEYGRTDNKKGDRKTGLSFDTVRRWDIRQGNVFIPIDSDFLAMHIGMKEYAPKSTMNQFASRSTLAQNMATASQNNDVSGLGQFK